MTTIQHNTETWNRSTGNGVTRRRVLLNRFYLPRIFPNGYRYTPYVVTHKNNAPGSEIRHDRQMQDAGEVNQRGPVSK